MLVSHSPDPLPAPCLHFIWRKRQEGGLGAFPGDDISFPLDLGEVINVNQRFDLRRDRWPCLCASDGLGFRE